MKTASSPANESVQSLQGASALVIDGVNGVTNLVEELHRNIASISPLLGRVAHGRTRGITGLVYRSVRGVTGLVGRGLHHGLGAAGHPKAVQLLQPVMAPVLKRLAKQLAQTKARAYRETVLAALNGVLGDHLHQSGNPLAIQMQFRQKGLAMLPGQALASNEPHGSKILVMVHGLCMNDVQWHRDGLDHGAALGERLGCTPLYLHYNTGRSIADNGADFSALLEHWLLQWPVKIERLVIVGHSMGGLVTRSACDHGLKNKMNWPKHLDALICLGTPHTGSPLERAGRGVDQILGISPYTAPFARLGLMRSQGIQDLRHGRVTVSSEQALWPRRAKLYLVAATKRKAPPQAAHLGDASLPLHGLPGDGLVPVASALGKPLACSPFPVPVKRRALVYETDHFQLLGSPDVQAQLQRWLA